MRTLQIALKQSIITGIHSGAVGSLHDRIIIKGKVLRLQLSFLTSFPKSLFCSWYHFVTAVVQDVQAEDKTQVHRRVSQAGQCSQHGARGAGQTQGKPLSAHLAHFLCV